MTRENPTDASLELVDVDNILPLPPAPEAPLDLSEDGLALMFLEEHGHELRYVHMWGRWMLWDGQRWIRDDKLVVMKKAHLALRAIAKKEARILEKFYYKPNDKDHITMKRAKQSQARREAIKDTRWLKSQRTKSNMLSMAMPDDRVASVPDLWDSADSKMLLNTPEGTIDLRTGVAGAHRPLDHITMITHVAQADMPTPIWNRFLEQITANDHALLSYLQRVCGYFLTGDTTEQAMFFGYGTGANGKSVMLNTVSSILGGEYHTSAPIETFIASQYDRHPTELANLRGARLVTSSETEQGRRWAEARLKLLTGGERISARFMRQDFFEFTPQFKLFIIGNHKPRLRTVDEAIRRRFHLIPFTVTIPKAQRDPFLMERLRPEWPGILNWMVRGCLEWQRIGLKAPDSVLRATEAYMAEEDHMTQWFNACCRRSANAFTSSTELYMSWQAWAQANDIDAGGSKQFSQRLEDRGEAFQVKQARKSTGRGFQGVALLEPAAPKT